MITEDYCSFEVAKLLKEKGFDAECRTVYTNYGKLFTTQIQQYITNVLCSKGKLWECTAPTLQMAMKWLREVHRLYVEVNICMQDSKYYNCIYETVKNGFAYMYDMYEDEITYYDTYEEACEAAIKYCLEHLI